MRSDGLEKVNYMLLGPVRYQYTAKDKAKAQGIAHFVYPRFTRAVVPRWTDGERMHPNEAYEIIRNHDVRDDQIIEDVKACVEAGRTPIVLSRYKDHSEKLYQRLMEYADHVFLLTGNHSKREHRAIREQMQAVRSEESLICFLQALFPQKCRLTSSKLHGEFPQYCISPSGTLLGAGEEPLQAYKVY